MTTIIDSAAEKAASPEAMLKAAVSGGKLAEAASPEKAPAPVVRAKGRRIDPLTMSLAAAGLGLGTLIGAGSTILALPRSEGDGAALAEIRAALETNRLEGSRLGIASDRLDTSVAVLKETTDAARNEARVRSAALVEKVGKVETAFLAKIAALGDRIDQAEREQSTRIASLAEKRAVASGTVAPVAKVEPVQTGTITDAKPKPGIIESWAVRDVYEGTAMLEDRRRRLIEVSAGGSIPGIGRVEALERRGREWVVVTRQGIVTPQPW